MEPTEIHQTVANDLINCSICLEIYKRPKYLPCLHTFCEKCLTSYIVSSANSKRTPTGFKCPICRLDIEAPKSCDDPAQWSAHLPVNHLIMTLMDQRKLHAERTECQPCKARNTETTAMSWCVECNVPICKSCVDYHSSIPILESHVIVPLDRTRSQPILISSAHELCEVHAGKKLEMFCRDHDAPCCVTCTMVNHRKCDNVITIQDAAKDCKGRCRMDLTSSLTYLWNRLDSLLLKKKKNLHDVQNKTKTFQKYIEEFRTEIEYCLDKVQMKLSEDLCMVQSDFECKLQTESDALQSKKNVVENCQKVLEACTANASDVQFYLESKKMSKLCMQVDDFLKEKERDHKYFKCRLELNDEMRKYTKLESMGSVISDEKTETQAIAHKNKYALPEGTAAWSFPYDSSKSIYHPCAIDFPVQKFYENSSCNVSACIWLPIQQQLLLVNNEQHNSLCTYDLEGHLKQNLTIKGKPWDVTIVDQCCVALTVPEKSSIIFVNTKSLGIQGDPIQTPRPCYGISSFNENIFVTCGNQIRGYQRNGKFVSSVPIKQSALSHLRISRQGTIYCADNFAVYMYDMAGKQLSTFLLGRPRITLDSNGTLFVFSPSNSDIHVVSSEGIIQRTFFPKSSGIRLVPKAVCFLGQNRGTFCIVSGSTNLRYQVKIYQLIA